MSSPWLIAVMGSTASGKTALAEAVADHLGAQLINADAFQVYRGLDIGTAKSERKDEYELIDIKDPQEFFGLGEWLERTALVLETLWEEQRPAVVVGGSGLYIRALFEGYAEISPPPPAGLRETLMQREEREGLAALAQEVAMRSPELAARTDLKNPVRVRRALERVAIGETKCLQIPQFQRRKFALNPAADVVNHRIAARVEHMFSMGWVEEVRDLRSRGVQVDAPGMRAHGYRAIHNALDAGEWGDVKEGIVSEVRQYAKRQRTWLRKEPSLQILEHWDRTQEALSEVLTHLQN